MITAEAAVPMIVIIPTHKRNQLLVRTLESLAKGELPPSLREVRVIENGGEHGAKEALKPLQRLNKFPLRYLYCAAANKSQSLNEALADLDYELVVFFDDDIRVHPRTLMAYHEAAEATRARSFFGGPFGCDYTKPPPLWLADFLPFSARGWVSEDGRGMDKNVPFMGFNWAAYAKDIKALGGFDPRVGPGGTSGGTGQESTMETAMVRAGLTPVYVNDAFVWHYVTTRQSSPYWALRRAYRQGITEGLVYEDSENSRAVAGVPLWMIRSCSSRAMVAMKAAFSSDPRRRHAPRHEFSWELGRVVGLYRSRH